MSGLSNGGKARWIVGALGVTAATAMVLAGGAAGTARAATMTTTAHAATARPAITQPSYVPAKRTLKQGDHGADVKALQRRLAQLKYYPGGIDGGFGGNTLEAVWAFQEVQGLGVDGVVGPATQRALVHPRTYRARDPRGGAWRVEVNLTARVLVLYRNNQIQLISHVSTGGGYTFCEKGAGCGHHAITPTGHYRTTVYMPGWVKVPLGEMYNPVFFIRTEFAIHGDTDVPLRPVSHGCVRIPMDIAQFFHNKVQTPGTQVYIYR